MLPSASRSFLISRTDAAQGFGRRFGEHFVLGPLPGQRPAGASGIRVSSLRSGRRRPRAARSRTRRPRRPRERRPLSCAAPAQRETAAQGGDQIAKQAIAASRPGSLSGGTTNAYSVSSPMQALEDIRLTRHREGQPYLLGRCRGRPRCRGESQRASPGSKPTRSGAGHFSGQVIGHRFHRHRVVGYSKFGHETSPERRRETDTKLGLVAAGKRKRGRIQPPRTTPSS